MSRYDTVVTNGRVVVVGHGLASRRPPWRGPGARPPNRPGFGTLAESMSGFAHLTGQPDSRPTLPPFGLADGTTGANELLTLVRSTERNAIANPSSPGRTHCLRNRDGPRPGRGG